MSAAADEPKPFAYDEVAYPAPLTAAQTPDRMRAAGMLYGYRPADCAGASVLEIGCGDGMNLIGIAATNPEARIVGFDLSHAAIARGRAMVEAVGLTNVDLRVGDILDYPRDGETFDYISCHGVYAWIPEHVRAPLLELIAARLAPGGIAYVSYDCLPAAAPKREINRFLVERTKDIDHTDGRIWEAIRLLGMITANQNEGSRLKPQLDQLADDLPNFDLNYFFHDWLADFYNPVSISGFTKAAAVHGLKVAGDAGLTDFFVENLNEKAQDYLKDETDVSRRADLVDFMRGAQMFRRTLLVRADAPPPPVADAIHELTFEFLGEVTRGEDDKGAFAKFARGDEAYLIARADADISVLQALQDDSPNELTAAELVRRTGLPEAEVIATLRKTVAIGLVLPRATPQPYVAVPGERPLAGALIRTMLAKEEWVITLRHVKFLIPIEPTRVFLSLCDGTRTREELAAEMGKRYDLPIDVQKIEDAIADLGPRRLFAA